MSSVGKILLVVHTLLSVVFMAIAGAASATQINWKKTTEILRSDLSKAQDALRTTQEEMRKGATENKAAVDQITRERDNAISERDRANGTVTTLTSENAQLKTTATVKTGLTEIANDETEARKQEVKNLREQLKTAVEGRDAEFALRRKLEDTIYEQTVSITNFKDQITQLLRENSQFREVLAANSLPTDPEEYERKNSPPPKIDGSVVEVRETKGVNRVEISLGKDDGIEEGHELVVYRSGLKDGSKPMYLGKIKIVVRSNDSAVGVLTDETKNGTIEKGDYVTTKF